MVLKNYFFLKAARGIITKCQDPSFCGEFLVCMVGSCCMVGNYYGGHLLYGGQLVAGVQSMLCSI